MKKILKKGLLALTLMLGMTFVAPQQASAADLGNIPRTNPGFKMKNIRLEIVCLEGTDYYLMVCRDETGAVIWAKMLGGNSL